MEEMHALLARLAQARAIEQEYRDQIAELDAELAQNPLVKRIAEIRTTYLPAACADASDAEDAVRRAALEAYAHNGGQRQVHTSVSIRVYTLLDYDRDAALEYARHHLPQALKLDTRSFENVAKVVDIDFVTKRREPRAAIARDLSAYLEGDRATVSAEAPVSVATG